MALVPFFPLLGFFVLALFGSRLSRRWVATIGVVSVGISALLSLALAAFWLIRAPAGHFAVQTLWTWIEVGSFRPEVRFRLDALSLVMITVVSFVSFLIHLYSAEFMEQDEGYSRYFSYLNLFVASMLILVLADNLLLLYLGWEGVGLCSYLLIGFWYRDPLNGRAARKAFLMTRIGDTAMAVGLFLLFAKFGTLEIQPILREAPRAWASASGPAILAAALLLGGALGKSAQLPLQTWLPDAMAGPTPVSALIHAATMVTAGVYLIARMHGLFTLAPPVQEAVAIIGAATVILAGFSALTQVDLKRILAYSTISQIGYMFFALGVGAWSAAIFHLATHAFFKALLFLGAGAVIHALEDEHDIFKMGGLHRELPFVFWTFLIGAASLAGIPWVTAGFYSKDLILAETFSGGRTGLWLVGALGVGLTSLYTFRMVFVTFFGVRRTEIGARPGIRMALPLGVLAAFSIVGGFFAVPRMLGTVLPASAPLLEAGAWQWLPALLSVLGVFVAYLFYLKPRKVFALNALVRFWRSGWGFDWIYDRLFVTPFYFLARINRDDVLDRIFSGIAALNRGLNRWLSGTQTGNMRWYATAIVCGAVIFVAWLEFP